MTPTRPALRATALLVGALLLLAAYFAGSALLARRDLLRAQGQLQQLRSSLTAGTAARPTAADRLAGAQRSTAAARHWVSGPLWTAAERLPLAGPSVRLLRGLVVAVDGSTHDELEDLVQVADGLTPARLRRTDGSLDLALLGRAKEPLGQARVSLTRRRADVRALPGSGVPSVLGNARARVQKELRGTYGQVDTAWRFATVGPGMLGGSGLRRYFVGIENNAELRGTGGNIGAYAVIVADGGTMRIESSGSSADYVSGNTRPVADLGPNFRHTYGENPTLDIRDSNFSPHYPYAARLFTAHWAKKTGKRFDGAIDVDPVMLSYVLEATGPVVLPDGRRVMGSDIVDYTLRRSYAEITDNPERKGYLQQLFRVLFGRLQPGQGSAAAVASALGRAAGERHLKVWSDRPDEQRVLEGTPLAGALPSDPAAVAVTLNSVTGGKIDYYLDRTVTYRLTCSPFGNSTVVTVTLRNRAPATGLPAYVLIRSDVAAGSAPPGQNRWQLRLHAPGGSQLDVAAVDGETVGTTEGVERGHPVYGLTLMADPGQAHVVSFRLRGPDVRRLRPVMQPLAHPTSDLVSATGCDG